MLFDRLKRREFITLLGGAAVAWPLAARAQQPSKPVIGFMSSRSPEDSVNVLTAFRRGLGEGGLIEGENVAIEFRWARGAYQELPALAAELVSRRVAVLVVVGGDPSALAAKAATSTVPIVFTTADDPITLGLVASLNRPGSNATGVSNLLVELGSKQLGLLRELAPGTTVVAALMTPSFPGTERQLRDVEAAARVLGIQLIVLKARTDREIDVAFATLAQQSGAALLVGVDPFFNERRDHIVALAARHAIPAIGSFREFAVAGGLMSYGSDFVDSYRQAGIYTGRVIRGEKPADLPVQRSTKFEFVINFKTAKALGLSVPNSMQLLADEVIE
jgi:putative tryptophan/tyrosine transport system substrate-binding protein